MCALILRRSSFGLLMGKFRLFLTELSARCMSVFSFPDDNFSEYQWILFFTKLCVCIDIMEIWCGIADLQISSIFDSYLPPTCPHFHFQTINLVNINGYSPNLVFALIWWRSSLGLLMGKFCQFLTDICP